MPWFRIIDKNGYILTDRGYVPVGCLREGTVILGIDNNRSWVQGRVEEIVTEEYSGPVNCLCTQLSVYEYFFPEDTLIYAQTDDHRSVLSCRLASGVNGLLSVYTVPPEHLKFLVFPGMVDFWLLIYTTPVNRLWKIYSSGQPVHGVSPLVLHNQLGEEKYSKFFRGLFGLNGEEVLALLDNLHSVSRTKQRRPQLFFRSWSDTLNFGLVYGRTGLDYSCALQTRCRIPYVYRILCKKNPVKNAVGAGFIYSPTYYNYKNSSFTGNIVSFKTDLPSVIYNTLAVHSI